MEVLVILVPLALGLGLVGLLGFLWSLKSGQYDDLEGAAWRAIAEDELPRQASFDSQAGVDRQMHIAAETHVNDRPTNGYKPSDLTQQNPRKA